jgi:hypothetical protein
MGIIILSSHHIVFCDFFIPAKELEKIRLAMVINLIKLLVGFVFIVFVFIAPFRGLGV